MSIRTALSDQFRSDGTPVALQRVSIDSVRLLLTPEEVAQMLALVRPKLVRRLILVGTGPRGGEGMAGLKSSTAELFAKQYERQDEMWLPIMFAPSETSQAAARAYLERIRRRPDRDAPVSTEAGLAHRAAAGVWGRPNTDGFADLRRIAQPTRSIPARLSPSATWAMRIGN